VKASDTRALARFLALALPPLVLLALCRRDAAQGVAPPPQAPVEAVLPVRCSATPGAARAQAARLEQQGEARCERAPFVASELPEAVTFMLEAEACYAVAEDRESRARARSRAELLRRELERRIRRTSLALELARRDQRFADIARGAFTLRALHGRAGPAAAPYRSWLERVARSAEAAAAQATRERK
jgi:hypothetical protein